MMNEIIPSNKVFFTQRLLTRLADEGRISLDKNILTLLSKDKPSFTLEPAYRLTATADGGPDPYDLVGRISPETEIKALKAEIYLDSVIIEETAYHADPGFLGEKKEVQEKLTDTELLGRFLLDEM